MPLPKKGYLLVKRIISRMKCLLELFCPNSMGSTDAEIPFIWLATLFFFNWCMSDASQAKDLIEFIRCNETYRSNWMNGFIIALGQFVSICFDLDWLELSNREMVLCLWNMNKSELLHTKLYDFCHKTFLFIFQVDNSLTGYAYSRLP